MSNIKKFMWSWQTAFNLCPFRVKSDQNCTKIDLWPEACHWKTSIFSNKRPGPVWCPQLVLNYSKNKKYLKRLFRAIFQKRLFQALNGSFGPPAEILNILDLLLLSVPSHLTSCKKSVESNSGLLDIWISFSDQ